MLNLSENDKTVFEMKYVMETYPVAIVFRDTGKCVAWSGEERAWCFYIDGESEYLICNDFHHAMQKLAEPLQ